MLAFVTDQVECYSLLPQCGVTALVYSKLYKKEKSLKMKGDVGMACQKVHKQGKIKVMVSIQSFIHPYIFSQRSKDVGMDEALYTYHHFYLSLFVYFLARHSYISFHF